ncbi:hypothetical protein HDZ31DRAFT_71400 [Schizophyllum fasciatum]
MSTSTRTTMPFLSTIMLLLATTKFSLPKSTKVFKRRTVLRVVPKRRQSTALNTLVGASTGLAMSVQNSEQAAVNDSTEKQSRTEPPAQHIAQDDCEEISTDPHFTIRRDGTLAPTVYISSFLEIVDFQNHVMTNVSRPEVTAGVTVIRVHIPGDFVNSHAMPRGLLALGSALGSTESMMGLLSDSLEGGQLFPGLKYLEIQCPDAGVRDTMAVSLQTSRGQPESWKGAAWKRTRGNRLLMKL